MKLKTIGLIILLCMGLGLYACQTEEITIEVNQDPITLTEGDTYQIDVETNDTDGISFEIEHPELLTISPEGLITAQKEGVTNVIISSVKDPTVKMTIQVNIRKLITLTSEQDELTIKAGQEAQIDYESNDDVSFQSSNEDIFTVDEMGVITGISEGEATLTIQSTYDASIVLNITIEVRRNVTLSIDSVPDVLWVGDQMTILYQSNADVIFNINPQGRATISEEGELLATAPGQITVTISSTYDTSVSQSFNIMIYSEADSIAIDGESKVNVGTQVNLEATVFPLSSEQTVIWGSEDEDIATVDQDGIVTFHKVGSTNIVAHSAHNTDITQSFLIEVIDTIVLFQSSTEDAFTFEGVIYHKDVKLFDNLESMADHLNIGTHVYIFEGTYDGEIIIDKEHVVFIGMAEHQITATIDVRSNHVMFSHLTFTNSAHIIAEDIENLTLSHNNIHTITHTDIPFISLTNVRNVYFKSNQFNGIDQHAIIIDGIEGQLHIEENIFSSMKHAIDIRVNPIAPIKPELLIVRNTIQQTEIAIKLTSKVLSNEKLDGYARFNHIASNDKGVMSDTKLTFDFTLNYWGSAALDMEIFEGVNESMLRGHYQTIEAIPKEEDLHPSVPLMIEFTNPIEEIVIGETYQLEYDFLPFDFETTRIRFLTSDPNVLGVTQTGLITPLRSGTATITIRSSINSSMATTVTIVVTTTPGIDFAPTFVMGNVLVGDQFLLNAETFPINYSSEPITYTSSDPLIATIGQDGHIVTQGSGTVTITATMSNHPDVSNTFTFNVYDALDSNNLMDLLTAQQVIFTTPREWRVYGVSFDFIENRYDSVSRYHFGDIAINTSRIVPVSTGIRPGIGFTELPSGVTQYNPYNVHWVVMHETANTSPGAGALAHANYLWNLAAAGSQPFVSWHFTIDDKLIYQHLPEIERGYHAGDGSVLPGQSSTYLGGGNRNGIGIEMAVNQDGDMYRTWQRAAKLAASLLVKYNLPVSHMRYHIDFSGKMCPQSTIRGGMIPLLEEFAAIEYLIQSQFADAQFTFESHNPDLVDHTGRVIQRPDRGQTVSYTITIDFEGEVIERTFYTYLPGTVK